MKKCIYYGPAVDFWWQARFVKFMDNQDYIDRLSDNHPILLYAPLVWHSHQHNVSVRYELENMRSTEDSRLIQRARVTFYGAEDNFESLEILIRGEAGRIRGTDIIDR